MCTESKRTTSLKQKDWHNYTHLTTISNSKLQNPPYKKARMNQIKYRPKNGVIFGFSYLPPELTPSSELSMMSGSLTSSLGTGLVALYIGIFNF